MGVIHIGAKSFASKSEVERYIRDLFWRYPPMGILVGEDLTFVLALIEMHPSRTRIVDCGIRSVHVQPVPFHEADQRRFLVCRTDESIRDFSWRNALTPKSAMRKLTSVLRHLVSEDCRRFKQEHFRGVCENENCRLPITSEECHVDHAWPATFERLVEGWLQSVHLTADDIAITARTGYQQHSHMEDVLLAASWCEYHEIHARLRCVCQHCNLSTLRRPLTNTLA